MTNGRIMQDIHYSIHEKCIKTFDTALPFPQDRPARAVILKALYLQQSGEKGQVQR
jgi:hypothetical protein